MMKYRVQWKPVAEGGRPVNTLREDIEHGFDRLERGEGIELSDAGLRELFDHLQARAKKRYLAGKESR